MNALSHNFRLPAGAAVLAASLMLAAAPAALGQDVKLKFEVFKDKADQYRWRLKAANGKILAVPEDAYKGRAEARRAVGTIQAEIGTLKVEYSTDKAKEYRWHLKAANGRVMARSSEGYNTREGAERAYELVKAGAKDAPVEEEK